MGTVVDERRVGSARRVATAAAIWRRLDCTDMAVKEKDMA